MKIKFNGLLEKKAGGGGCNCKRQGSSYKLTQTRMFTLPSGTKKVFYAGSVTEVSERDGEFLLSMNGEREVFTEVGE